MHIIHGPRQLDVDYVIVPSLITISYCNNILSFTFYERVCGDMIDL